MSLKTKIILTLVGVFLAAGVSSVLVNTYVILPSFEALERDEAEKNTHRVIEALNQEIQGLASTVSTWGWWDDTYRFVQDGNTGFADTNLSPEAVAGPQVSYIAIYGLTGRRIGSGTAATSDGRDFPVGELSEAQLPIDYPLFHHEGPRSGVGGLVTSPQGPLVVVSYPIRRSNGDGPTEGSCLMVRPLDAEMIERLSTRTKLKFALTPYSGPEQQIVNDSDEGDLAVPHRKTKTYAEADSAVGVTELADIHGHPLLQLKVFTPREISARGWTSVNYALVNLTAAAVVLFAVLLAVIQRTLFRPLSRLTEHVTAFGGDTDADLSARLNLQRKDELGTLANEFDRMTDRLAEARHRLAEQSFDSGRADMAAGILHNIGNAVTPLGVRLSQLSTELRAAPLEHIDRALTELASGAIASHRKTDLEQFLQLASGELVRIVRNASEQLNTAISQLTHAQQILNDQERYSRNRQQVEPVSLAKVIRQSYDELTPDLQQAMALDLHPSVLQFGTVNGSWVAIRQVVSNLMINAAEAIAGAKVKGGRMRIHCILQPGDNGANVHAVFADNGPGISEELIARIFSSGFSTKQRGSGTGLHWCANAASAMHGRLYAESKGIGQGSLFHLIMPATMNVLQSKKTAVG